MDIETTEITEESTDWHLRPAAQLPPWLIETLQLYNPLQREPSQHQPSWGIYAAQLLWQRGLCDRTSLLAFLDPDQYQPASPFEFEEMEQAVQRLQQASAAAEQVTIWGDFDADGITATAVLKEGLSAWIAPENLQLYIPDRFTESHGLSMQGIEQLAQANVRLIVTCDTGSTHKAEIERAKALGMDFIITDHHTLATERPPAVALINPRSFSAEHPLADLSGVAVAYKLLEALQERSPRVPNPLPPLLELVAIGLIADLVALRNDSRYLAQQGLKRLQTLLKRPERRPGVAELLKRCRRSGDRPTDISFGIGPRINAVSRIQGRAEFCVELLTQRDCKRARQLADQVELLNTRRRAIQRNLEQDVRARLEQMDLSTTAAIVLAEVGWPIGVLGLVAGQVARDYGRPTVLLCLDDPPGRDPGNNRAELSKLRLARGSARSVQGIDFYPILESQQHLLTRFGGHPLAAGLSLPVENLELFAEGLDQELRRFVALGRRATALTADLEVTVAELGQSLFRELKLLEPYGMGNPVPMLLVRNCQFKNARHANLRDARGGKVRYVRSQFELVDASSSSGFGGVWWGHYCDELLPGPCDVVGQLDFNASRKEYEFRLEALRPADRVDGISPAVKELQRLLLDWRGNCESLKQDKEQDKQQKKKTPLCQGQLPSSWSDFRPWLEQAQRERRPLALAYSPALLISPTQTWHQLLGLAKYLSRTQEEVEAAELQDRLNLDETIMQLAWGAIADAGFEVEQIRGPVCDANRSKRIRIHRCPTYQYSESTEWPRAERFLAALRELRFRQEYFLKVPLQEVARVAAQLLSVSAPRDAMCSFRRFPI